VLDLLDQLARRRKHEGERPLGGILARDRRPGEHMRKQRQQVRGCLARAGGGDTHDVLAREAERDAHHLHGRRLLVPGSRGGEDGRGQHVDDALAPPAHRQDALARRIAQVAPGGDLMVLTEDAPVALSHLCHRLLRVVLSLIETLHFPVDPRRHVHYRADLLDPCCTLLLGCGDLSLIELAAN